MKRRHIKASERDKALALISGTTDYSGFAHRDVVIEAVFEDTALKQKMVADVEEHCAQHTIFASNTSSLPIGDIAANSARPELVIGLHFFSPVEKCRWWKLSLTREQARKRWLPWLNLPKCRVRRQSWWRIKLALC